MTKQLASINEKNLKLGDRRKFEIVLISYDRDQEGFDNYLKDGTMNWPAVKFSKKGSIAELTKIGDSGFLPNIVLLKADGTMVSNDREEVLKKLGEFSGGS